MGSRHVVLSTVSLDLNEPVIPQGAKELCPNLLYTFNSAAAAPAASEAEEAANNKRWQESGGGLGPADQW